MLPLVVSVVDQQPVVCHDTGLRTGTSVASRGKTSEMDVAFQIWTRTFAIGTDFLAYVAVSLLSSDCFLIQWNALLVVVFFGILVANNNVVDDSN